MMERSASLSSDGLYRWTLTRRWGEGGTVCWIMLNPSTADAEKDDPTIRSIIKRSRLWGYGGLVVVNRFPLRTPFPETCRKWARRAPSDVTIHNAVVMKVQMRHADLIVAAWGAVDWLEGTADEFELHCIGTTASGAPKHPLARGKHWVPEDTPSQLYRRCEGEV